MGNKELINTEKRLIKNETRMDSFIDTLIERSRQILQDKDATPAELNLVANVAPLIINSYHNKFLFGA